VNGWVYAAALSVGFTLAAAGMSVFLLLRAQWLLRAAGRAARSKDRAAETANTELEARLESLAREVRELERRPESSGDTATAGMNISKRTQVLRLHRRGESAEAIAAVLGLRRREVELLVKIHGMAMNGL
jgi:hypothetical protein